MHLSLTIPLLFLLPLGLSHGTPLQQRVHHPSRRSQLARREAAANAEQAIRRADVLSDIVGTAANSTTATSTTEAASTVKSIVVSTEASTSSVISTTSVATSTVVSNTLIASTTSVSTSAVSVVSSAASSSGSVVASSLNSTGTTIVASSASTAATSNIIVTTTATSSAAQSSAAAPAQSSSSASVQYTTDAAGQTQLVTVIETQTAAAEVASTSTTAAAAAATTTSSSSGDGSISTPAIVGISVAVGAVVIALIGFAIWRMKRRTGDEDEAIRWPELNRHGDSSVHHALPASQTGRHGIETNPLERSLSNSSSLFSPASLAPPHSAAPMALNGSSFGAASSLEEDYMSEKYSPGPASHDDHENYTSLPPPLQMEQNPLGGGPGGYDTSQDGHDQDDDVYGGMTMANANPQHVSYGGGPASTGAPFNSAGRYRIE